MDKKGFFQAIFVIIMLVFLTPTIELSKKTQDIHDFYDIIDSLVFASDEIVADAISDQTYDNSCSLSTKTAYDNKLTNYFSKFLDNEFSKFTNLNCSFSNNSELNVPIYEGELNIRCKIQNGAFSISEIKTLNYKKEIDPTDNGSNCNIKIIDNLDNDNLQVDLTQ